MYIAGIDTSKYKHTCFIMTETGEVIKNSFSLRRTRTGNIDVMTISSVIGSPNLTYKPY